MRLVPFVGALLCLQPQVHPEERLSGDRVRGGHLQARKRVLKNQICWYLDPSLQNCEKEIPVVFATSLWHLF